MLSCREVTRLYSEALERPLGPMERMNLKVHILFCTGCRNFGDHMQAMRTITRAYARKSNTIDPPDQDDSRADPS